MRAELCLQVVFGSEDQVERAHEDQGGLTTKANNLTYIRGLQYIRPFECFILFHRIPRGSRPNII
jgi:hypothetical protein